MFYFHPYLGKWSNLTSICFNWVFMAPGLGMERWVWVVITKKFTESAPANDGRRLSPVTEIIVPPKGWFEVGKIMIFFLSRMMQDGNFRVKIRHFLWTLMFFFYRDDEDNIMNLTEWVFSCYISQNSGELLNIWVNSGQYSLPKLQVLSRRKETTILGEYWWRHVIHDTYIYIKQSKKGCSEPIYMPPCLPDCCEWTLQRQIRSLHFLMWRCLGWCASCIMKEVELCFIKVCQVIGCKCHLWRHHTCELVKQSSSHWINMQARMKLLISKFLPILYQQVPKVIST